MNWASWLTFKKQNIHWHEWGLEERNLFESANE